MEKLLDKMNEWAAFVDEMSELVDKTGQTGELVKLYVYDLTQSSHESSTKSSCSSGVGAIATAYHTSIVVAGEEYTFGCKKGISVTPVNHEKAEKPDQTHVLGRTRKTKNELKKFVEDLGNRFKKENYELLNLNCQVFCSELCEFLGVEKIPEYVTKLLELARDIFGTEENLIRAGETAVTAIKLAAVVGIGYAGYEAYKKFSKNDENKN